MTDADELPFDMDKAVINGQVTFTQTLEVSPDDVDAPELFDAYIEGFKQSAEHNNAEQPFAWDDERIRNALRESFAEWLTEYASGEIR